LAQAVCRPVGSQGAATDVPALRVGTDRSWLALNRLVSGVALRRATSSPNETRTHLGLGKDAP
jgi:hypothetical protein